MMNDRESTRLPPAPRRKRRDWGRLVARIVCAFFAVLGILPVLLALLVRSSWAQGWATQETERIVHEQGVDATYRVQIHLWPLSVELDDVRVASSDGGAPFLTTVRASVRPRFFALLAGKLVIDQIDVDTPRARVVVKDGQLKNLSVKLPESKSDNKPFHAPFEVFAITDGELDVTIDDLHVAGVGVDLDVTADDDPEQGSSFEIAVRTGITHFDRTWSRKASDGTETTHHDEDALCAVDGRVRIEPKAVTVHHLSLAASADLDPAEGTRPACDLPKTDRRRVDLELSHVHVRMPEQKGEMPHVDGHIVGRLPIGLADRGVPMPDNDGWVAVDVEARFAEGMNLPEANGRVEVHEFRILRYRIASEIKAEVVTQNNVIESPRTEVHIAGGTAILTKVSVEPFKKGIPIKAKVDVTGASFAQLMRELGVSQHPHVTWDLDEVHVPEFAGTLDPLKLDGDMTAKTGSFAVYDADVAAAEKTRAVQVTHADLAAHVAVRPAALEFARVRAVMPRGLIEGGFVSIGFHDDLRVEVPSAKVELADIGPLGSIPLSGKAEASAKVTGLFNDPHVEGQIAKIEGFTLADIPFGDVTGGDVSLDGLVVSLKGVKAQKGKSLYEVPAGKIDFGVKGSFQLDAAVTSPGFSVRDFFSLWKMEEDPRFTEIDGTFTTRSNVRVALGGPLDKCGGGFIDVDARAHLKDVKIYGEEFEDGDLDLDYEWDDRLAGIDGAHVDVHAATLRKLRSAGGGAVGTALGSAKLDHGALTANVVLQGIPLSRIQALGPFAREVDGAVSGIAQVSGRVDAYRVDGDIDVTPVLVRGTRLGSSHVKLGMTQTPPTAKPVGKTRCGGPISAAFDKDAYLKDTSSQGEYLVDGDLFGGQVKLEGVSITRQADQHAKGRISLKDLDLGAVARIAAPPSDSEDDDTGAAPNIDGKVTATIDIENLVRSDLAHAAIRFSPIALMASRGGERLTMRKTQAVLALANDSVEVPPLVFDISAGNGLQGTMTVYGAVHKVTSSPELALGADLLPIDLGILVGIVPKLDRAVGTLSGSVRATGKASGPDIRGFLTVRGGEFVVHGAPGPITEVNVDVQADANEVRITKGSGRFAGGTLALTGRVPIRGFTTGAGEIDLAARGIRLAPEEGVSVGVDADLSLNLSAIGGEGRSSLPHLTGDVYVTAFEYTRPISLTTDLSALGVRARRTVVESYDPSRDAITIDLHVHARTPLRIRNNLVEVQLGIDSGTLEVTGTNQRVGLRGQLRAQQGGRFHLRSSEFEIRQALIRFDDPTRIAPNVDVLAITEYRRYGDSAGTAASASTGRQAGFWRITVHAYGDTENLRLDMTSDPPLSQEDIVLLLTVGMTRAEVDQLQTGALGAGAALEALATVSGADRAVKSAIPVIDDFRFGSGYSSRTGRTEPQVTLGKRITDDVRANVTTGLSEDRELRSNIEWRLGQRVSVQGSYDNVNDVSSSTVGNVGVDLRWRLEFK